MKGYYFPLPEFFSSHSISHIRLQGRGHKVKFKEGHDRLFNARDRDKNLTEKKKEIL